MSLPPRIVLHAAVTHQAALGPFVERCLRDDVRLIAVVGDGADALEEEIDWLVIGDGTDDSRYICTSAHPNETIQQVLEFAAGWHCERGGLLEVRL